MPLTYPLAVSEFQDVITVSQRGFFINHPLGVSRTAGGSTLRSSLGEPLWSGTFSLPPTNDRQHMARVATLISVLDRAGGSFLVYDPAKPYPANDPDGTYFAGQTVTIASLDVADARLVGLAGLGAAYTIKAGDYIGWTYTVSGSTRYALHQAVEDVTSDGLGDTGLFEVTPFIQPGVTAGDAVTMVKPPMKATLDPDPNYGSARPVVSSGVAFGFTQDMRGD